MANLLNHLDWGNWIYGLFAALIGGGSTAVVGAMAVSAIDSREFSLGSLNSIKVMGIMFLWSGGKDFFLYLKQNPLPAILRETTVQTVEKLQNPPAVVTTTVKTTEVSAAPAPVAPETPSAG